MSSWHASGGGGGDDDDNMVRLGCRTDDEKEATRANSRRAVLKVPLPGPAPFTYADITSATGPKSPHHPR